MRPEEREEFRRQVSAAGAKLREVANEFSQFSGLPEPFKNPLEVAIAGRLAASAAEAAFAAETYIKATAKTAPSDA